MTQFPTPGHAASRAKLTPRSIQSGATSKAGRTGKGNSYLRGATGVAVMTAARTESRERVEPGPVTGVVPYPAGVPAQHRVLVPEHQQPGVLRPVTADHQDS